jgi:hypothetical protein
MMSRRLTLLFLGLGALLLALQIRSFGLGDLWSDATTAGWVLVPIVLFYGIAHGCDAQAWRVILGGEPNRPGWLGLYRMVVSGSALNFLTPMVNLGGEPFKAAFLASSLGVPRAAGAVLIRNVARGLGLLCFWLAAIVTGWFLLPPTPMIRALLLGAAAAIGLLMGLLIRAHRRGGLERLFDGAARLPGIGRVVRRAERFRPAVSETDRQIVAFAREQPGRLAVAVGFEVLGRAAFVVEFCLIGWAIGVPIAYPAAFTVGGLETLTGNLLFFVPYEIGTRETATMLLFGQLGYPPEAGLFAALVSRLRDLAWIVTGVVLVGLPRSRTALESLSP